jgi:phage head maturation protease
VLTDVDLWEVSLVTFPANPAARVTAVKAEADAALAAAVRRLRRRTDDLNRMMKGR